MRPVGMIQSTGQGDNQMKGAPLKSAPTALIISQPSPSQHSPRAVQGSFSPTAASEETSPTGFTPARHKSPLPGAGGIQSPLLLGSLVVRAALARMPFPSSPLGRDKGRRQGPKLHFVPLLTAPKDEQDQASHHTDADIALGSEGAQQILHC